MGIVYIPPGTPWNNGFIESFNRRLRAECLNRNHWTSLLEARINAIADDLVGEDVLACIHMQFACICPDVQ
ncbi:integrase core domain-containing protein [Nocardia sp. NRRL WC-3656]|uniref:integrase core domain-containing protein n=1 Tax=Nocardia sp. NRRL WC-3656 TaxID=1463824 RepID=UPI0018CC4FFB